jgi:glycerol-3-phosphate dehydrogenase
VEIGNDEIKVKTDKDRLLTSNFLVNAGGLWADEIAGLTGDEITFELGKGVILVFDRRQTKRLISPAYLKPDPKTKGGAIMFTVEGRGLWGPNLRTAKNKGDVTVEEEDIKALTDKFGPLLKEDLGISIKAYAGIRPIPPENDFRITYSSRSRRIVHILGTESPAYTASPAIAEKVVSMLASSGLRLVPKKKVFPREPFPRIRDNPEGGKGEIVCLCSMVTEEEIREAVRRGSKTLQGVMFRTGAGMGICQGGRCMAEIVRIIAEELGTDVEEVTLRGGNTWIVRK